MSTTVYVSIGNSDDKLTQFDWSQFLAEVDRAVSNLAQLQGVTVHGRWHSLASEPWQNACWCFEVHDDLGRHAGDLREWLGRIAGKYRQDSIAWAVAETEFIPGATVEHDHNRFVGVTAQPCPVCGYVPSLNPAGQDRHA